MWALSSSKDRNALRIVLIASLASEVIVDEITRQIASAWKLVIPGAVEIATILALLRWARNRTGYWQAGLLIVAWIAHVLCYVDCWLKTDIVYSRYEAILYSVSAGQLVTCYDTMRFNLNRAYNSGMVFWEFCTSRIYNPSVPSSLSGLQCGPNLSKIKAKRETQKSVSLT